MYKIVTLFKQRMMVAIDLTQVVVISAVGDDFPTNKTNRSGQPPRCPEPVFYFLCIDPTNHPSTRRCLISTRVTPRTATPKASTSTMLVKIDWSVSVLKLAAAAISLLALTYQ